MLTLDEHNYQKVQNYDPNAGVLCPKCKKELFLKDPNTYLTSDPPKQEVFCKNCDFTGYKY